MSRRTDPPAALPAGPQFDQAPVTSPVNEATRRPQTTPQPVGKRSARGSPEFTAKRFFGLCAEALNAWFEDRAASMGAALAYYTLFSIAPVLLIAISVAGLVFGAEAARGEIFGQLRGLMGNEGAAAVEALLSSLHKPGSGVIGTIVGAVVLVIGATTVFAELQSSLDAIWRVPNIRVRSGIWGVVFARLLSFGMVLATGFLLMVSLVFSAVLAASSRWWGALFGGWEVVAGIADASVGFALMTLAFAMIYKFVPRVYVQWRDVWVGAAVTALLFTVGKLVIGLYIGKSGIVSGFGAASSIVVLLVWVYYSAQVFLLGAEFTWVFARNFGSRRAGQPLALSAVPGDGASAGQA